MVIDFDYASLYPSLMKSINLRAPQDHLGIMIQKDILKIPNSGPANHIIVSAEIAEILKNIKNEQFR